MARRYIQSVIFILALLVSAMAQAQIENVLVETYYVSDASDATDTTGGRSVEEGSVTYRIYIDLLPGTKIIKIYGDQYHPLKISSTENFYNNIDRPNAYFGYLINKAWFTGNPTLALDSWLTLGLATKTGNGILKSDDFDGSYIGGANNNGGTAGIAGGLLVNDNPLAGIPLTSADGIVPNDSTLGQWIDFGFRDFSGVDTTVFGADRIGNEFVSYNAVLQQSSGVVGADSSNRVLVAQLTTKGEISFKLNIEVREPFGSGTQIVKYVANNDTLLSGEVLSPFLTYPPACGCTDPNFFEYNEVYVCGNPDSCRSPVVYGCKDTLACNFDPNANFSVPSLCCYIGYCNDRDISVVCPRINNGREARFDLNLFPNPAQAHVTFEAPVDGSKATRYMIYDSFGRMMLEKDLGVVSGGIQEQIDLSGWGSGLYVIRLISNGPDEIIKFVKN